MPEKKRATFICLLLALITLAVYWPATGFDFTNYDDPDYVIYNPVIHSGITRAGIVWAFKASYASNWHPLTWISHMTDCALYGLKPGGHHLTNLLFHSANSVLLFLVLLQLTGAMWRSALVAALFAWHPLHVESVAWVSERKDVLSTFFWLLTMSAYAKYATSSRTRSSKSKAWYCGALFCFALGLLSKPMVVTLPFVLLLLDYWPLNRIPFFPNELRQGNEKNDLATQSITATLFRLFLEKIPFLALAGLDCLATFWAQRESNSVVSPLALPLSDRLGNALVSYILYLWKMLWPTNLALPYPYSHEWTLLQAAGAALFLGLVTTCVLAQSRTRPFLIVGWLWFLGTLVPVIGLVQVGIQFMADRYSYVPLTGVFIMAAWGIPAGWAKWPRPGLIFNTVVAAVLAFLLAGTETQLQYWRNSVTLFAHTVSVTPNNILAEYNLAEALARSGDDADAIIHYKKALAIHPNRVEAQYNSQTQAHFNLGLIYRKQKQWAEVEKQFRAFLESEPYEARGRANLAVALVGLNRVTEAEQEFRTILLSSGSQLSKGDDPQLLTALDEALAECGHFPEAIAAAQKSRDAALAQGKKAFADAAEKRIESYRAAKPK